MADDNEGLQLKASQLVLLSNTLAMIAMARALVDTGVVKDEVFIASLQKMRKELALGWPQPVLLEPIEMMVRAIRQKDFGKPTH